MYQFTYVIPTKAIVIETCHLWAEWWRRNTAKSVISFIQGKFDSCTNDQSQFLQAEIEERDLVYFLSENGKVSFIGWDASRQNCKSFDWITFEKCTLHSTNPLISIWVDIMTDCEWIKEWATKMTNSWLSASHCLELFIPTILQSRISSFHFVTI